MGKRRNARGWGESIRSNAVMHVEHAGHAVEAEPVKAILFHPEAEITEQEAQHLVVTVVEETAIPELVTAFAALVEVQMVGAIEHVQSVKDILGCVAVDDVEEHDQSQTVCRIDELLKILGCAVSAARSEEVIHLIAEAGIVGVLHHGHQLDGVVTQTVYAWEHVRCEFFVGGNASVRGRDTDVRFVDAQALGFLGSIGLELVSFAGRRVPEDRVVGGRYVEVLHDSLDPGGDSIETFTARGDHCELEYVSSLRRIMA